MKKLLLFLLVLTACHGSSVPAPIPVPSPETPCAMILRTEGVSCTTLQSGADVGAPIPDPVNMYNSFVRGRARAALLYPTAANIKMSSLNFWQTQIAWNPGEAFPRMASGPAIGAMGETVLMINIFFAFPECIEHETVHSMVDMLDPTLMRTASASALAVDADQAIYDHVWQITCHLTSDDPIINAAPSLSSSGRAGCVQPYSGLVP